MGKRISSRLLALWLALAGLATGLRGAEGAGQASVHATIASPAARALAQGVADLQAEVRASAVLPPALAPHVRAGPLDAEGWSLLAANAGVAAKLRHLKPHIEQALSAAGWTQASVRIKVISV